MLPKSARLNLATAYSWIVSGSKIISPVLKVYYRFGDNKLPRIGIAVSKTVFKRAVDRNAVKRKVAEAAQNLYPGLRANINLMIVPGSQLLNLTVADVDNELSRLLSQKDLLKHD